MKIALLDPFHGGSHKQWSEDYAAHSTHEVQIFSLPGRHWKWRMHGGAIALAEAYMSSGYQADLVLATDMLDLTTFLALTRKHTHGIPTALYFHENQLTYPWSPTDADVKLQRDNHYAFVNYTSALAADACFFNSPYHLTSFTEALPGFLKGFPDKRGMKNVDAIRAKSEVLDLGLELSGLEKAEASRENKVPVVVWNHRWEYDKGPDEFFKTLFRLENKGVEFQLVVLGEGYGRIPAVFEEAKSRLTNQVLHWGFAESRKDYAKWLSKGSILPVTSRQDFFGGSIVEAMHMGCRPLLPNRLNYPHLVPQEFHAACIYAEGEFESRLEAVLTSPELDLNVSEWVAKFDWKVQAPIYDAQFLKMAGNKIP